MTQPNLFEKHETGKESLKRVRSKLESEVIYFWELRRIGETFHMHDIGDFINFECAPDSPGRIMRLLKREDVIDYVVVSRKDSLYRKLK